MSGMPDKSALLDNYLAAQQHGAHRAFNLCSLVGIVIDVHMMRSGAQHLFAVRVEEHQISVTANGDGPLARIEAKQFGWSSCHQINKVLQVKALATHTTAVDEAYPCFNAGQTVRNLGEIIASQVFLTVKEEGAVVGGDGIEGATFQRRPERCCICLLTQRWRANVFRCLEIR